MFKLFKLVSVTIHFFDSLRSQIRFIQTVYSIHKKARKALTQTGLK